MEPTTLKDALADWAVCWVFITGFIFLYFIVQPGISGLLKFDWFKRRAEKLVGKF